MNDAFIVLATYGPTIANDSYVSNILSVSYEEKTAWTAIEKDINKSVMNSKFGDPYIIIYPRLKSVRVSIPICCGCDGTNIIHTHHDYKIIRKTITDELMKFKIKELKDLIKDAKNMDDELSKEEKIDQLLELIERCMTQYPEWVDEPGQDRYYAASLVLHKSQMQLVREALQKLKNEDD